MCYIICGQIWTESQVLTDSHGEPVRKNCKEMHLQDWFSIKGKQKFQTWLPCKQMDLDARKTYICWIKKQRCRPVWVSVQSDQRLCFSLTAKCNVKAKFIQNFIILDSLCSWEAWLEHDIFANPKDRFSCYKTQIIMSSNWDFLKSFPCQDKWS